MAAKVLRLNYYAGYGGRGRCIRMALRIGGIAFEDNILEYTEWPELKAQTPFGTVPVLEVNADESIPFPDPNATLIGTSNAGLYYAGSLSGLVPTDPLRVARVLDVLDWTETLYNLLTILYHEADPERKENMLHEMLHGSLLRHFTHLETLASVCKEGFYADHRLTVADLKVEGAIEMLLAGKVPGVGGEFVQKFPNILRCYKVTLEAIQPHDHEKRSVEDAAKAAESL